MNLDFYFSVYYRVSQIVDACDRIDTSYEWNNMISMVVGYNKYSRIKIELTQRITKRYM